MDERLRILKMVEDGTITAEQAAELMKAMGVEEESQVPAKSKAGYDKKMFRIIVRSKDANFRMPVPIGLASVVVKLIPKAVFDKMGEDVPKPYDSLVSKDIICMIFEECMDVLKENKGLEIIHVEAVDGTFVSITL